MIENFLYYVWQHKKLDILHLRTTQLEPLEIVSVGLLNVDSGPDFFNGQLRIGDQLWAGNIEIHVKSSDWFLHNHERDPAYDSVILHVVYEHDTEIFRKDNTKLPTLELKNYINKTVLESYYKLFSNQNKWINCENDISKVPEFTVNNWLERLYFDRLERKSKAIEDLLFASKNDWEAVLFKLLAKNFGLKVNGDAFMSVASSMDFSIVRKVQSNLDTLEALFFGQSGLLEASGSDGYYIKLKKEYQFLKQKFQLDNQAVIPIQFFRLRPPNFPTIRLSQLANVYHCKQQLFAKISSAQNLSDFYELFDVATSSFWDTHYTFEKTSKRAVKKLNTAFIDLLLINTIIPLKFCYAKQKGRQIEDSILELISSIDPEKNNVINGFSKLQLISKNAMQSQALLQLKVNYCDKHQCLKCAIGNSLLTSKT